MQSLSTFNHRYTMSCLIFMGLLALADFGLGTLLGLSKLLAMSKLIAGTLIFAAVVIMNVCSDPMGLAIVPVTSVLWASIVNWGAALYDSRPSDIVQASIYLHYIITLLLIDMSWHEKLSCGHRRLQFACCGLSAISSYSSTIMLASHWHSWRQWLYFFIISNMALYWVVYMVHKHQLFWRALQATQEQLAGEKDAFGTLLSMLCDAEFWVAADGNTILRSDHRFDALMRRPMKGSSLQQHFTKEEQERFRNVVECPDDQPPVSLLPVTLARSGLTAVKVELFIADRRHAFENATGAAEDTERLGFLVGLRLTEEPIVSHRSSSSAEGFEADVLLGHPLSPPPPGPPSYTILAVSSSLVGEIDLELGFTEPRQEKPSDLDQRPPRRTDVRTPTSTSAPETLASGRLAALRVVPCSRQGLESTLADNMKEDRRARMQTAGPQSSPSSFMHATLRSALSLVCDHALGGALVIVASSHAFAATFTDEVSDCSKSGTTAGSKPQIQTSDGGYMTERLRHVHISDPRFTQAFREFTAPAEGDRWPLDYPDASARGQPKDGAILVDTSGYRVKCAAKLLGLRPVRLWQGVGTKHEAALACAWAVENSVVLVRSSQGSVHCIMRAGHSLIAYRLERDVQAEAQRITVAL